MFCNHSSTVGCSDSSRSPLRISASHCSVKSCIEFNNSSMLSIALVASGVFSKRYCASIPVRDANSKPKS